MFERYSFSLPTQVEFQAGIACEAASMIKNTVEGKRVFLVTDPGLMQAGIVEPVLDGLKSNGYETELFDRVQPNPKDADCEAGGKLIREFAADIVLAVGGGSVLDAAKAIAMLHTHEGRLAQYEGRGKVQNSVTPLVTVPTTAGTGSEVTRSAVITDTGRKFKMTIKDIRMAPRLAIVDPQVTYSLPPAIAASTGMDAFVHAIEAFTCKAASPFSDAWAREAMRRIFPNLREAAVNGTKKARDEMMLGSLMAGVAFSHADVAAVHCLAEALGGLYDTPHGVANSIFLPIVTEFNVPANPAKHAEAARICGLPVEGLDDLAASAALVAELRRLAHDIGIPQLKDVPGVDRADFGRLAEASFVNGSTPDNCRDVSEEDYLGLLEKAFASGTPA